MLNVLYIVDGPQLEEHSPKNPRQRLAGAFPGALTHSFDIGMFKTCLRYLVLLGYANKFKIGTGESGVSTWDVDHFRPNCVLSC